jgi:hypothetical protein
MTDRELMQQALDALFNLRWAASERDKKNRIRQFDEFMDGSDEAIEALRARLAQPEPEPVVWADKYDIEREGHDFWVSRQANAGVPLYTVPPQQHSEQWWKHEVSNAWAEGYEKGRLQREWIGLTDEDKREIINETEPEDRGYVMALVEAKLKGKNIG